MSNITPFLWFDGKAEAALNLYVSVFKDARISNVSRYGPGGPGPAGAVMTASFSLLGQDFIALNGGPMYQFTPAISFMVRCETQDEVDHYWNALSTGGSEQPCGWLRDQFGVSWQIIPTALSRLLSSTEPGRAGRVMQAMLKMKKIDIDALETA